MKKYILIKKDVLRVLFFFLTFLFAIDCSRAEHNGIVAIVNNVPITKHDLDEYIKVSEIFEGTRLTKKDALQNLIDQELIAQKLTKIGDSVTDNDIDRYIEYLEYSNNLEKGTISNIPGIAPAILRKKMRNQIAVTKLSGQIASGVKLFPLEVGYHEDVYKINAKDKVQALELTPKRNHPEMLDIERSVRKNFVSCDTFDKEKYQKFYNIKNVDLVYSKLSSDFVMMSDTFSGTSVGKVYTRSDSKHALLLICKKISKSSNEQKEELIRILRAKKVSENIQKLVKTLRSEANIKIFLK